MLFWKVQWLKTVILNWRRNGGTRRIELVKQLKKTINGICPEKRTLRKEATGQCAPDLKRKNSFLTKVQSNRTTGRGKKWWTNGAIMPQKRTERSRSGRGCTVTTEPSHHRYSLPPVHRHHHHHHHQHCGVCHHPSYDGDTKTMIMMVLMTWLSHSSGSWCSWREPARQVLRNIFDFILTTLNFWLNDSLISC